MRFKKFAAASMSVVLSALMLPSTRADEYSDPFASQLQTPPIVVPAPGNYGQPAIRPVTSTLPMPQPAVLHQAADGTTAPPMSIDPSAGMTMPQTIPQQSGYVRLGAPMYPSPKPNIPIWTGGSMITSPALAPHEMLYPHTYRAIYPPFYHRVTGGWMWTPFGMRSHERWELQGTQVEVSYRSRPPIWVNWSWHRPMTGYHHGGSRY